MPTLDALRKKHFVNNGFRPTLGQSLSSYLRERQPARIHSITTRIIDTGPRAASITARR